ncbi:MAG: hypothetical protein NTZ90_10065 [Proteobacteria bacterium]|nr:hypothetical protein [Pseudomonadota bacterium]
MKVLLGRWWLVMGLVPSAAFAADLPADLGGRYAHYDIVAYDAPMALGVMRSQVITYGFTDLRIEGESFTQTETFCHAEHRSNLPFKSRVADSFTRAIVPPSAVPTLSLNGGVVRWLRPETPTALGIHLDDPSTEALPNDPRDPRISDDDHDGHPGVTVNIDLGFMQGQIYLARREIFAYDLSSVAPGRFEGVVHDRSEQLTLGGYPSFIAADIHPVQNGDLSKSPIILQRVDSDYTCDRLMAERDQWFPPEPL